MSLVTRMTTFRSQEIEEEKLSPDSQIRTVILSIFPALTTPASPNRVGIPASCDSRVSGEFRDIPWFSLRFWELATTLANLNSRVLPF